MCQLLTFRGAVPLCGLSVCACGGAPSLGWGAPFGMSQRPEALFACAFLSAAHSLSVVCFSPATMFAKS